LATIVGIPPADAVGAVVNVDAADATRADPDGAKRAVPELASAAIELHRSLNGRLNRTKENVMTPISSTRAVRTFDQPDMRVVTASGNADCRRIDLGEVAVGHAVLQPGFRWSADVKTLPGAAQWVTGELCELRHLGLVIEGRYRYEMADGTTIDVGAGETYDIPGSNPHDECVVGDSPCVVVDVWPSGQRDDAGDRP
jgi:hypothetical protein